MLFLDKEGKYFWAGVYNTVYAHELKMAYDEYERQLTAWSGSSYGSFSDRPTYSVNEWEIRRKAKEAADAALVDYDQLAKDHSDIPV